MPVSPVLLQFAGSLFAILLVAWLVKRLGLGQEPRLDSEASARRAAEDALAGFNPAEIALDYEGRSALLRDQAGNILLLRPHGAHFAGRLLTAASSARMEGNLLVIDTGERHFGSVRLLIDDPAVWLRAVQTTGGNVSHA